jgi:hypothetical protein
MKVKLYEEKEQNTCDQMDLFNEMKIISGIDAAIVEFLPSNLV